MNKVKYALFPTLLDSFYWYKRGYNEKEELINKINRVKSEMPEAAAKGVAFEDCVNHVLKSGIANHEMLKDSIFTKQVLNEDKTVKFTFTFQGNLILKIAQKLINCTKQQEFIQANISTPVGLIKVYGYIDFSYPDMHVDLKTTGSYKKDKYKINNQHKCYPLLNQINGGSVSKFNYLVTDFNNIYVEPYVHDKSMIDEFIFNLCEFTEFLEVNRDLITDKKIFGL